MTKILIIGSNSFVGRNFVAFSKYKDIDEISLFNKGPEDIDFRDYNVILHLAAIVHQSKVISEEEYMAVNKDLCLRVAQYAKKAGIRQFVFMSSLKVYGDSDDRNDLRDETSECFPSDSYGRSKYAAEKELEKLADDSFIVSIIRTPLIYGSGLKGNMIRLVKLIDRFPILPFARINNKRNCTYTENLVGFIDRIIEKRAGGIFIAKDDEALSTTELVRLVAASLNKKIILFKLPSLFVKVGIIISPAIFQRLYGSLEVSNEITKKMLNYKPSFSSDEGISRMVRNYITHKND